MDDTNKPATRIGEDGYEWYPVERVEEFNPDRYDFRWNEDYTEFRPIPLQWWDDASYRAYQGEGCSPNA